MFTLLPSCVVTMALNGDIKNVVNNVPISDAIMGFICIIQTTYLMYKKQRDISDCKFL